MHDPVPEYLQNPKFSPWFDQAIGAMDGTCITCCPSAEEQHAARNKKGTITQNCLACVLFAMKFVYIVSGWEGSAANATMNPNSHFSDVTIPPGKFYLADAEFGICDSLLVPFHGVHYRLTEWGHADTRYSSITPHLIVY